MTVSDLRAAATRLGAPPDWIAWAATIDQGAEVPAATGAELTGAVLAGARLRLATLTRATLRGAELAGAELTDADISDADLTAARRLPSDAPVPGWVLVDGRLARQAPA